MSDGSGNVKPGMQSTDSRGIIRLNFMFTVAAVATNVCALLVGAILDQYGPRVSGVIGSILFAFGCLGFGFAKQIHQVDRTLAFCLSSISWNS